MNALIVYNPAAGSGSNLSKRLTRVRQLLAAQGIDSKCVSTSPSLDLSDIDLLIVMGGDGTLHQLLPQLADADLPVALLPSGTANVLATELNIPTDLTSAIQLIERGITRTIPLGQAADRYFLLMAGVGLDGYVIARVNPWVKRRVGILAFWYAGLFCFWGYRLDPFRVQIGQESYQATFAVVSRSQLYGKHFKLSPQSNLFESRLDVCLFTTRRRLRFLRYLISGLRGKHIELDDVIYRAASVVEVSGDPKIPLQMDGELIQTELPLRFTVGSRSIQMYVPES